MKWDDQTLKNIDQQMDQAMDAGLRRYRRMIASYFAVMCESPIEVVLGSVLFLTANIEMPPTIRTKLMILREDKSPSKRLDTQIELVPQHVWNNYRIDFAVFSDLSYPIFIECDGHDFHERTKEQAARDREKDRTVQAAGIPILRFTGSEIFRQPVTCAGTVLHFISDRLSAARRPEKVRTFQPSPLDGWLIRKTGERARAHIWSGADTVCRMWSTGGLIQSKYQIASDRGEHPVCHICQRLSRAQRPRRAPADVVEASL